MNYRTDKFAVGDMVTWFDDHFATIADGRKYAGDGPFKIIEVINIPQRFYLDIPDRCNWDDMGHTQHLFLENNNLRWSGAYFKKVN